MCKFEIKVFSPTDSPRNMSKNFNEECIISANHPKVLKDIIEKNLFTLTTLTQ
jgi:hypothetical protein